MENIQIFVTGGTFDKTYNYIEGKLFFEKTHLPEMLQRSKSRLPISVKTLMMKDSLDLTEADTATIINACMQSDAQKIVITHGTDRMTQTAAQLAKECFLNKTIILTGAMIPYAFGSSSDGFFNLGCALAFVQTIENGIYLCMNGQIFTWDKVCKNTKEGFFEPKENLA